MSGPWDTKLTEDAWTWMWILSTGGNTAPGRWRFSGYLLQSQGRHPHRNSGKRKPARRGKSGKRSGQIAKRLEICPKGHSFPAERTVRVAARMTGHAHIQTPILKPWRQKQNGRKPDGRVQRSISGKRHVWLLIPFMLKSSERGTGGGTKLPMTETRKSTVSSQENANEKNDNNRGKDDQNE